jgi:uncharacterized membrane protein
MATIARERPRKINLAPDPIDRFLAAASVVLLVFVLAAIARGRAEWSHVPPIIWAHIATILTALSLTPLMLLRRRGDRLHRRLGWVWAGSMALSALMTFGIREINDGRLSPIHVLSLFTLVMVPMIVIAARRHQHARHRGTVRGMVAGALLIAGFFTFPVERLMGRWLFG